MSPVFNSFRVKKSFISLLLFAVFLCQNGFAAEVDSVTPRKVKLDNSLTQINAIFNQRLAEGIAEANVRQDATCDEEILYTELRKGIFQSLTASWGLKGYALDKQLRSLLSKQSYSLSLKDSIYRDIDYLEGFSLKLKELSDVVSIDGHLVGLDKIGHFFAEGWQYFEMTRYQEKSIEDVLQWGKKQEVGKFGYTTTGIYSFADLAANFNGYRFWNKVLLKENDPLKGVIANFFNRPYVSCKTQIMESLRRGKIVKGWKQNRPFDLSDYLDGAWDEGNNCNSYNDPVIEEKVKLRIAEVTPDFSCPVAPEECVAAQQKYDDYAKEILHPHCLVATEN